MTKTKSTRESLTFENWLFIFAASYFSLEAKVQHIAFAYCYETYGQIRKTLRLQSAILPSPPRNWPPHHHHGERKQCPGHFFNFSSPWEPGGLHSLLGLPKMVYQRSMKYLFLIESLNELFELFESLNELFESLNEL